MRDRMYYSREAEEQASRQRVMAIVVFLTLGVVVGTALALLFAPQSGRKTRRNIASSFESNLAEGLESTAATVRRLEREFAELRHRVENGVRR